MKPENQKARRKTPLNIFRAEILDLYNSGFSKKQISRDLQQSTRTVGKKNSPFLTGHSVLKWVLSSKFKLTNNH